MLTIGAFGIDRVPAVGAGLVARHLCSGIHVAGRTVDDLWRQDLWPVSLLLRLADATVDPDRREVRATLFGLQPRHARWLPGLGCVLEPSAALQAVAERTSPGTDIIAATSTIAPGAPTRAPAPVAVRSVADPLFNPARGDRAVVLWQHGRLVGQRHADDFGPDTPHPIWSVAKSLTALLVADQLAADRLDGQVRAIDWIPAARRPDWLDAWRHDARAQITIGHLLSMRDGLDHEERYLPWQSVPRMLWAEADIGRHVGSARSAAAPGSRFAYHSATTNLLAALLRARIGDDADYLARLRSRLLAPLGIQRLVIEPDASGTLIGSSFGWATAGDLARIGHLLVSGGLAPDGRRLLPAAAVDTVLTASSASYAGHVFLPGRPQSTYCPQPVDLPADTAVMAGTFGQTVAVVPSRAAVIVRLGWTVDDRRFDRCRFIADALAAMQ